MKDAIGQTIEIGDTVAHAGISLGAAISGTYPVVNVTEKRVTVIKKTYCNDEAKVPLDPRTLINVTMNLATLEYAEHVAKAKAAHMKLGGTVTGRHSRTDSYVIDAGERGPGR